MFKAYEGALDIHYLYKRTRTHLFTSRLLLPLPFRPRAPARAQVLNFPFAPTSPATVGSGFQGKWIASSVTEKDIKDLREARYLTVEIKHRLPTPGQVIPTPEPDERVVSIPHFLRGLGFALHPFVRGLMYYYGLDFHDLAPNSFLHISVFIIVCEAFLHVPHTSACGSRFST
mgnify:CR=1 FL=1